MEESPDRNLNTPSSAVQGSPFFNYLCNLSPIKPVKSSHVAQTFSELNFPPPPPVFTSPRISSQKELTFLRRPPQKDREDEENKNFDTSCEKTKDYAVTMSECDVSASLNPAAGQVRSLDSMASNQTKCDDKIMSAFPGCSPSKIVEQFLAEPVEEGHYTVDSSKLYSKSTSPGLVEALFVGSDQLEQTNKSQCDKTKDMETISHLKHCENFVGVGGEGVEVEISQGNEEGSGTCHDENLVDQTANAFSFLLSQTSTHNIEAWHKASSADLSNMALQQDSSDLAKYSNKATEHCNFDVTPQPPYNSFQDINQGGNLNMKLDSEPNRSNEQTSFGYKGTNQPQRGMRRRCLDFEASEARRRNFVNSSWKSTNVLPETGALIITDDSEKNTSSTVPCETVLASDSKQLIPFKTGTGADTGSSSQSASIGQFSSCSRKTSELNSDKTDTSVRNNGNVTTSAGVPSGIGLHLNSLASMSLSCGMGTLTSAKGSLSMQRVAPSSGVKESSGDGRANSLLSVSSGGNISLGSNTSMASGMVVSVVEKTRVDQQEVQSSGNAQIGVTKSTTCFRSLTVGIKPLQCRLPYKSEETNPSPLEKKRSAQQDISQQPGMGLGEEFNQSSPKKKRKSASMSDKEGCKRCNCKKSKCLKLYCECFAAGVYCVEPCTCQECFNKPEYEDMVLGTRQQIESRNPLAFAPKIVRGSESPPTNGEECSETPASARHKRGCNCKKSMCLKKYCECFQAGVGCSDGCRCEGCKNVYGKKEGGPDEAEERESQEEAWVKDMAEEKVEFINGGTDIMRSELQHPKDLSPITPSFQYPGQGKSISRLKCFGKRRFPEDSESPTVSQSSAKPPRSPGKFLRPTTGNEIDIYNRQAGPKTSASPIFTPKMEKTGKFSAQWNGLGDISTLTPALQPPLRPPTSSMSNVDGTEVSPFGGQHNEVLSLNSHTIACRHSCHESSLSVFCHPASQSPVCTSDSVHWQTTTNVQKTPLTPVLYTSACNTGNKLGDGSDIDMHTHSLSGLAEDDTPDILKNHCSPMRGVKASSPNQKRVSPPHNYCLKEMANRVSTSSPGLKSGKKFILQSVPSFPPLTPTVERQAE